MRVEAEACLRRPHRRGSAATIAMVYLVLMSSIAVATFFVATLSVRGAVASGDLLRARAMAESGIRWQASRLRLASLRPVTTKGNLDAGDADTLWPQVRDRIAADWSNIPGAGLSVTTGTDFVEMDGMQLHGGHFRIRVERLEGYETNPLSDAYRQFMRVTSTGVVNPGSSEEITRAVSMNFSLDKRIDFAIAGKTRIQIGRNTLVEGDVAMGTAGLYPPFLVLSDFTHFDTWLKGDVESWARFLKRNHDGYGNRVSMNDTDVAEKALAAGFTDYNEDGYMDEFDLFLRRFDEDGDKAVSREEFSGPDGLREPNLWHAIDSLGAPMFAGDPTRAGYMDDLIDSRDFYFKIGGTVTSRDSESAWQSWMNKNGGGSIHDVLQGPVVPSHPSDAPVTFGAPAAEIVDLDPANFEDAAEIFRGKTGESAGAPARQYRQATDSSGNPLFTGTGSNRKPVMEAQILENTVLSLDDANVTVNSKGSVVPVMVDERTPHGSSSWQATYRRPVFRNMHLKNVVIPKGMNPLFENCTFEGVTFVDMTRDIVVGGKVRHDSGSGMDWSKRMKSGSFSSNTPLTSSNSLAYTQGNNVRFESCTFEGPLVNPYSTAYTHFSNSWEFTGETLFDNKADETATIVAPQTNIEMGSFERPGEAPSKLVGVVVAGNIDIRGVGIVDGSILVTGDGAGNTTLGYFGASDGDTDPSAMPEGGYGRLNVRFNPYRALPDGIALAVIFDPIPSTYTEH